MTRYLAVTASSRLAETLVAGGALPREQVAVSDDARRIRCNNADVMVLNGWTPLALFIAVLYTLNRLNGDSELIVMNAAAPMLFATSATVTGWS